MSSGQLWPPASIGWRRRGDEDFAEKRDQQLRPTFKQIIQLAPLAIRYAAHFLYNRLKGLPLPIDSILMLNGRQMYGVPCGGIGAGTIGRGFRGEFCRFQMVPGIYSYATVWADAFHVCVRDAETNEVVFQSVLASQRTRRAEKKRRCSSKPLSSWQYNIKDENIDYVALYPQSWTTFHVPEVSLKIVCRQVSPFLPRDYHDSSLPVSAFEWSVENYGDRDLNVTVAMTFRNGWGDKKTDCKLNPVAERLSDESVVGVQMAQTFRDLRLTYAIGGLLEDGVQVMDSFDPESDGKSFWEALKSDEAATKPELYQNPKRLGMAIRAGKRVASKSTLEKSVKFVLCWDMPSIKFKRDTEPRKRRYSRFFPSDQKNSACLQLIGHGLSNCDRWVSEINRWQDPVLTDARLPDWFKSCLFNEMYYIADGGTQWLEMEMEADRELDSDDPRKEFGRFLYLEAHEYRLYNTYDVHFYASFALASLFPMLQLSLQRDFCDAIVERDDTPVRDLFTGQMVTRKVPNTVPHDVGNPDEAPIDKINAYDIHDVSVWKDLNLKFVISVWRDHGLIRDTDSNHEKYSDHVLRQAWPLCVKVMEVALTWDKDDDGLIENGGKPDQTYDSWVMTGPSAYCGGLWIAALHCLIQMAQKMNESKEAERWQSVLDRARTAYIEKLWNGRFFKFDTTPQGANVIMSDQLCGQWYLNFLGEAAKGIFDRDVVAHALDTIFEFNVEKFAACRQGAVNGMLFDSGKVDRSTVQSEEIWTGSTYALAALMIAEGKTEQGFRTAEGIYRTVYERIGMGFETPEALYTKKHYRAIGYMRPLSVWSMYMAWKMAAE